MLRSIRPSVCLSHPLAQNGAFYAIYGKLISQKHWSSWPYRVVRESGQNGRLAAIAATSCHGRKREKKRREERERESFGKMMKPYQYVCC